MKKLNIKIDVSVMFEEYASKRMNKSVEKQIRTWLKDTLNNCAAYIPFYVEEDDNGSMVECCTRRTKVKVK